MLALCDCNNFFVSCERLYHPELRGRPVVVLSSNYGCIISRSNEVKVMGIKMGEPYFQIQGLLKKKGVIVCSGNLSAYKEISDKVMRTLSRYSDETEAYSIDEAFLNFPKAAISDAAAYAAEIRGQVDRTVGIPLSVGVAPTKTLAKLASERAKKTESGVFEITEQNRAGILSETDVKDVWGIGYKATEKLQRYGVMTAADLTRKDPVWVKKHLTIRGVMTQRELAGHSSFPLVTQPAPPKSIQVSRTWGSVLETGEDVNNAILDNVVKAGRLLRRNHLAAGAMSVYIRYGYRHSGECGYFTKDIYFDEPVLSDIELIAAMRVILAEIYKPGYRYTQGGIILCRFSDANYRQRGLFCDYETRSKLERLSYAVDSINEHFGERVIYPSSLAIKDKKWRPHRQFLTNRWDSLKLMGSASCQ